LVHQKIKVFKGREGKRIPIHGGRNNLGAARRGNYGEGEERACRTRQEEREKRSVSTGSTIPEKKKKFTAPYDMCKTTIDNVGRTKNAVGGGNQVIGD